MAKECYKPKRVKDNAYHKEKMMLCKQEEKGVQFNNYYNVFANDRQHFEQPKSINDKYVVEKVDNNVMPDSSDMCDNEGNDDQNAEESEDEHVVHANLIANLKLDTCENKKIQNQLKKANASLAHELKECKSALKE
ncbi:hypothetical protein Tco_0911494 [Tanacetum coccineum]|uniref:Uncharacterized protein n=1 Tax=Tanacetum coccineum TaxID=301880 RepID=A0ABQ5CWS6_9ASTR